MYGKNRSSNRRCPLEQFRPLALLCMLAAVMGMIGCGVDVRTLVQQNADALGRTFLDLLLTDLANQLADAQTVEGDQNDGDADDDNNGGTGDGDGADGDNGDQGDGGSDVLVGDPAPGEALYASCSACHCADGSGGCLPGAPSIIGASAELLDEFPGGGGGSHVPFDLTNQDIVDLEAFLATLGG